MDLRLVVKQLSDDKVALETKLSAAERDLATAQKALEDFDAANKEDHTNKAVAAWRRLRAAIAPRAEGPAREASHAK